jgi:hypothetical protein
MFVLWGITRYNANKAHTNRRILPDNTTF